MNSLQDLNTVGSTPVDHLDSRASGVIFQRQYPLSAQDQELTINSTVLSVGPGDEITEIINYQTANVRYRVVIQSTNYQFINNSSITFPTIPSGVIQTGFGTELSLPEGLPNDVLNDITLNATGNVYTVSGIQSVNDWNTVKNFIWTIPSNYNTYNLWYLIVSVIYYNSALGHDVERTWYVYDERYFYISEITNTSTMAVIGGRTSPATVAITNTANVAINYINLGGIQSSISNSMTMTVTGQTNAFISDIRMNNTTTVSFRKTTDYPTSDKLNITNSFVTTGFGTVIVHQLIPRSYTANQANAIFALNTPVVDNINPTDTFEISLSSTVGQFAANDTNTPTNKITISGNRDAVNAAFINVRFYPTKGTSATGVYIWQQKRNGNLELDRSITLTGIANNFATKYLYLTGGSGTWTPTLEDTIYGLFDILIVGGGGSGGIGSASSAGGGGGGGGVIQLFNQTLTVQNYAISIGSGGSPGAGGTSRFDSNYAYGGQPGSPGGIDAGGAGGTSGDPTSFLGSPGSSSITYYGGGGGGANRAAGASQPGGTVPRLTSSGGETVSSNIKETSFDRAFGGGGGGGGGTFTSSNQTSYFLYGGVTNGGLSGGYGYPIRYPNEESANAYPNTGGGGGGAARASSIRGFGGSGIVVIKTHA